MARQQHAFKGHVGIGFEATGAYGTEVARTTFARFIDAEVTRSHGEETPETSRLAAPENVDLGDYDVNVSATMEVRPNTVDAFLKAFAGVGSVASAQPDAVNSPTVYEHTITPKDERQPVTWERALGTLATTEDAEEVVGVVLEELTFEQSGPTLMMSTKGPGKKDTLAARTAPTFDSKRALLKHEAQVTLGGTVFGVKSARVSLKRVVTKDDYETGSRYRVDAGLGMSVVETEMELAFRDLTLLKRSLGGAAALTPQDDPLYNADKVVWTGPTITDDEKAKLEVDLPRVFWQPIGLPMRGKDAMTQRVVGRALYDETATYQWRAKVVNTKATP